MSVDTTSLASIQAVLDLLPIGACVISSDLKVHAWNELLAEWTGIPQDRAIGMDLGEEYPSLREPRYNERLMQVFDGMPAVYSSTLHKHFIPVAAPDDLSDALMIQRTQVRLLDDSNGLALIAIQNLTHEYRYLAQVSVAKSELEVANAELEESQKELKHKNKELDEFTHMASHDLQEPLRKLVSFSELLAEDAGDGLSEDATRDIEYIQDAGKRMMKLVRDLLALSRAGRSEIAAETVDLNLCAAHAIENLSVAIDESGATVERGELPKVRGDVTLLTQLYQNLIANALKFTVQGKSPRLTLTSIRDGDEWILGVQDSGIGIEADQLDKIFAPFKRLHGRSEYAGSGIGLAICAKMVDRHGGRIWVESTPGEGSHFRFSLAVMAESDRATTPG